MNKEDKPTGGDTITPTARRSIHSDHNCIFSCTSSVGMGKYGLNHRERNRENNTNFSNISDDGIDEVDNVLSKFQKPSSPIKLRNKYLPRRNSLNSEGILDHPLSDDESDISNVLAKSLPATLPSHSHYSGDNGFWSVHSDYINQSNEWRTLESTNNSPQVHTPTTLHTKNTRNQENKQNGWNCSILILFVTAVIAIVAILNGDFLKTQVSNSIIYDELEFHTDLSDLGRKYKITDDTMLQIQTGVSTIYKRQDAGSFVFVYNSNSDKFDPVQFNKFMNDVASSTSRYLRNDSGEVHHIVVDSSGLNVESHSELINKYKDDVHKSGVMLVKDLDLVPSKLAMAFHYYCDEYNPLVRRSAIFFTLNMAKCNESADTKSMFAQIEKCLKKTWNGGVPHDNIGPLLTRVVASVVDITNF